MRLLVSAVALALACLASPAVTGGGYPHYSAAGSSHTHSNKATVGCVGNKLHGFLLDRAI